MDGVLVAYTTNAGSTAEVAQAVGEEIARSGVEVDVRRLDEVGEIVVMAAPLSEIPVFARAGEAGRLRAELQV